MTTHERELPGPADDAIDLCTPEGRLDRAALGWTRFPRHRANLGARTGRNKRWDYWAVLAGDLVVSAVYSDVDHLGLADVWWADLTTGATGGAFTGTAAGEGFDLPERCGTAPLVYADAVLSIEITDEMTDEIAGTHLVASWTERDGAPGALDLVVALPADHESLNVVIPWDDDTFNYTSKHQARPATGTFTVGDRTWRVGGSGPEGTGEAWGVLDVGRGRWPHEITWNWGGGAGRDATGEHVVGLQFGARWTEGSGFTENGLIVDGRLSKIGRELTWTYDWDEPTAPWTIDDPGGQLHAVLTPRHDKHTDLRGHKRGSEVHQVFGTWAGRLRTDDGLELTFTDLQGFAEEARQRW